MWLEVFVYLHIYVIIILLYIGNLIISMHTEEPSVSPDAPPALWLPTNDNSGKVTDILSQPDIPSEVAKLQKLSDEDISFRGQQNDALGGIIDWVQSWYRTGLAKLAIWVGKTYLFWKILRALGWNNVILVPNIPLISNTRDELVGNEEKSGVGYSEWEVFCLSSESDGSLWEQIQWIPHFMQSNTNGVIILTYHGFNQLAKSHFGVLKSIFAQVNCIISDEWHKSLWEKTQSHFTSLSEEDTESEDGSEIDKAEAIISEIAKKKLHLYFTATPGLTNKNVLEYARPFYMGKIQDAVNDGTLILPTARLLGHAYATRPNDDDTTKDYEKYRYFDEDGKVFDEVLIDEYVEEKKAQDNYLLGIYACRSIEHAESVTQLALSKWVKAVRVTSGNGKYKKGMDAREAKKGIQDRSIDLVITVQQVAEWWDVRTLRCYLQWCAIMSPAKSIQLMWRIMRSLSAQDLKKYPPKNTSNTLYMAPRSWDVLTPPPDAQSRWTSPNSGSTNTKVSWDGSKRVGGIMNAFEMMHELGEVMLNNLTLSGYEVMEDIVSVEINKNGVGTIWWVPFQAIHPDFDRELIELLWRWYASIELEWLQRLQNHLKASQDHLKVWQSQEWERYQFCSISVLIDKMSVKSLVHADAIDENGLFAFKGERYYVLDNRYIHYIENTYGKNNQYLNHSMRAGLKDKLSIPFFNTQTGIKWRAIRVSKIGELLAEINTKVSLIDEEINENGIITISGIPYQAIGEEYRALIESKYAPLKYEVLKRTTLKNSSKAWLQENTKRATMNKKTYVLLKLEALEELASQYR